eukprot:622987-Pyramimonas_sp.AAC.1
MAVLPERWAMSALILQHVHRRLGPLPAPRGACLPGVRQWRRDRPVPVSAVPPSPAADSRGRGQAYVDDIDDVEI